MDAAFVISCVALLLVAYVYLGYPILIGLCAAIAPRRSRPNPDPQSAVLPSISILLPVFDAAAMLPAKLRSLLDQSYPARLVEILVYCDGCSDGSERQARELAASLDAGNRVRVFAGKDRLGKPSALNFLASQAKGDLLLLNDVRQPLSPGAAARLAKEFSDPSVGCATGRLVLAGKHGSCAYWRYEDWIRSRESMFRGVVGMTGAIAMMRRRDFVPLPADIILDDVWMPMQLATKGKRVVSVRDAEAYDTGFADDREFCRKTRTLAGNYQIFALMPALLSPFRNPIWLETVSHKALRLLAPWLLALSFVTSGASAFLWEDFVQLHSGALFSSQVGLYTFSAIGPAAGRFGALARTFVVLNAAAVVGLWRYVAKRQRVTW